MENERDAATEGGSARAPRRNGGMRRLPAALIAALALAAVGNPAPPATHAAGIDPLPMVARALGSVQSYEVVTTTSSTGSFPRPRATPKPGATPVPGARRGTGRGGLGFGFGPQTRTIVAVRKGTLFEDYVVIRGKDRTGKAVTSNAIVYGNKLCTRSSGSTSYTCRTGSNQYSLDPTAAFAAGAGSTTFTAAPAKTVNGQRCDGYRYANTSQYSTASGVVYIAHATNLPCEQDSTMTRRVQSGGTGFTQRSTTFWSHFNDKSLSVPAVP